MNYKVWGKENERVLLFIHGALVSQTMWMKQVEFFQDKFKVITCNLPGHSDASLSNEQFTIEDSVAEIHKLLNELAVEVPSICGHSLGGMVAQSFAYRYPERVDGLILTETSFGTRNNLYEKVMTYFSSTLLRLMTRQQIIRLSIRNYGQLNEQVGQYISAEMNKFSKSQILEVMSEALTYNGSHFLKKIKAPTLILVGQENKVTHSQAKAMQRLIPHASLKTISSAHHLLNLDNSEEFNSVIDDFLESAL